MADFDPVGTVAFFRERYRAESATTARVLEALPEGSLSYRPHPRSSTAGEIAWTIVRCLRVCEALVHSNRAEMPRDGHPDQAELVSMFGNSAQTLAALVLDMTQDQWCEQRQVISRGVKILNQPLGQILWLFHFDAIHHRGQLSTILRLLDAKVPSIYGHSADAPVRSG